MPVGGRASSQVRQVGLRCGRGVGWGGTAGHAGKRNPYGLSLRFSGGDEVARAGSAQENQARKNFRELAEGFLAVVLQTGQRRSVEANKMGERGCIRT